MNSHHEEWLGSSTTTVLGRAALKFASPLGCEQMVMESTHIDGGVFDSVLTDVHGLLEIRVGSPVVISDHSAIFIDIGLEQSIPHLVCRQEVYLKNSVDWELVKGDVNDLNWNEIIRFPCPLLTLNEDLLRVIRNRVPKRMIVVGTGTKTWFDDRCVLAHPAKKNSY